MTTQLEILKQQRISGAREALHRARALRSSRRTLGVDGICQHVKDVDGDWLENWSDEKHTSLNTEVHKSSLRP